MTLRRALSLLVATALGVIGVLAPPAAAATPVGLTVTLQSYFGGPVGAYPEDLWIGSQVAPAIPGWYDIRVNGAPYASGASHSGYYGRYLGGGSAPAGPLTIEVTFTPDDPATYDSVTTTEVFQRPKGSRDIVDIGSPPSNVKYGETWSLPESAGADARLTTSTPSVCTISPDGRQVRFVDTTVCLVSARAPESDNYLASMPINHVFIVGTSALELDVTLDPPAPRVGDLVEVRASATFQGDPVQTVGVVSLSGGGSSTVTEAWPVAGTWEKSVRVTSTEPLRVIANVQPQSDHRLSAVTFDESVPVARGEQHVRDDQPAAPYVGQSWTPTSTGDGAVSATVAGTSGAGVCAVTSGARVDFTGIGSCVVDVSATATASYDVAPAERRTIAVAGVPTSIRLTTAPTDPKVGDTLTVTAEVTGPAGVAGTPTGSVRFDTGAALSGRPLEDGSATFELDLTTAGAAGITATYVPPTGSTWAGSEATVDVEVGKVTPVITWTTPPPTGGVAGAAWRPQATATFGRPVLVEATGDCAIEDGEVRYHRAGSCTVTARTEVTADHAAASLSAPVVVAVAPTTVTGTFAPASPAYGESTRLGLTVTGRDHTLPGESLAGVLRIVVDDGAPTDHAVPASGVAPPYSLPMALAAGPHTVEVTYVPGPGSSYGGDSWAETLTVTRAAQTVSVPAAPTGVRRGATWSPEPTSTAGLAVTLGVDGTCTLDDGTVTFTRAGTCTVTASQAGDANRLPADEIIRTVVVAASDTAVTLTVPGLVKGESSPLQARVQSSAGTPPGTVQFRLARTGSTMTDLGEPVRVDDELAVTSWTPPAAGSFDIEAEFVPDDAGLFEAGDAGRTVTVGRAAQAIDLSGTVPVRPEIGASWTPDVSGGPSGQPVELSVLGAEPPCRIDGAVIRFTAAGDCEVAFDQAGDADHDAAPRITRTIEVIRIATTLGASGSVATPVVGQPVTIEATVSPVAAGTVRLVADGDSVGEPVAVVAGAGKLPFTPAEAGEHALIVEFTPADAATYTPADRSLTVEVDRASTDTTLTVGRDELRADVEVVAPGGGTPAGEVAFVVDGDEVGTAPLVEGRAVLPRDTAADGDLEVEASYSGSTDHGPSTDSTVRTNPAITAEVTSAAAKRGGWYTGPVLVRFTCTEGSAALTEPCPEPVRFDRDGVSEPLTRSVTTRDGGRASVRVDPIRIDASAPEVRILGARDGATYKAEVRTPRCAGTDAVSGIAECRIAQRRTGPQAFEVTATATDAAGHVATRTVRYRIARTWLVGLPAGSVMDVRRGSKVRLATLGRARPTVRVSWGDTPRVWRHTSRAGLPRWKAALRIPRHARIGTTYVVRVRLGDETARVRLRVVS